MAQKRWIAVSVLILITAGLTLPVAAHPTRRPVVSARVALGPAYYPHGFVGTRIVAIPTNHGRVDFNINPKDSKIWVDGAFIGIADQWDGGFFGTTATLKAGTHRVRIVSPSGEEVVRKIYVMPGKELNLDITF